jgi:hypothetical protein
VKIKDVINEAGFLKSFGTGMLPTTMQTVIGDIKKPTKGPDPTDIELAQAAYEKFGPAPGKENLGSVGWLTDEQFRERINAAKEKALQNKRAAEKFAKKTAQSAKAAAQQTGSPADMPTATPTNIPQGHRIVVQNPQRNATFYKYPDGRWTDEYGTVMPAAAHGALEQIADTAGRMEQVPGLKPAAGVRGFKRGARRAR